jgi:hypothetical protein
MKTKTWVDLADFVGLTKLERGVTGWPGGAKVRVPLCVRGGGPVAELG